jgi:hypothetical protein
MSHASLYSDKNRGAGPLYKTRASFLVCLNVMISCHAWVDLLDLTLDMAYIICLLGSGYIYSLISLYTVFNS